MGRGVRTVQRWEQELGLPVRRPRGKERSAVIALKSDLDHWLNKVPQGSLGERGSGTKGHETLHLNTDLLLKRMQVMLERSAQMQEVLKTTVELTSKLREEQSRLRERALAGAHSRLVVRKALDLNTRLLKHAGGGQ